MTTVQQLKDFLTASPYTYLDLYKCPVCNVGQASLYSRWTGVVCIGFTCSHLGPNYAVSDSDLDSLLNLYRAPIEAVVKG